MVLREQDHPFFLWVGRNDDLFFFVLDKMKHLFWVLDKMKHLFLFWIK
jgi:hypothetical protein